MAFVGTAIIAGGDGDKAACSGRRFLEEPPPGVLAAGTRGSGVTNTSVQKPLRGPAWDGLVRTRF